MRYSLRIILTTLLEDCVLAAFCSFTRYPSTQELSNAGKEESVRHLEVPKYENCATDFSHRRVEFEAVIAIAHVKLTDAYR